jgi:hypothetical protein
MKKAHPPSAEPALPVDVERLRRQFPALTAEDVEAYVAVTRRILSARDATDRARITRETLARGRAASAEPRDGEERLAARYVAAVAKMQGR